MEASKKTKPQGTKQSVLEKLNNLEQLFKKKDNKPLSFKEACVYLGFTPSYLYKLTYRKAIPHYKPAGKMLFFSKCELDEWIFSKAEDKIQKSKDEKILDESEGEEDEIDPTTKHKVTNEK